MPNPGDDEGAARWRVRRQKRRPISATLLDWASGLQAFETLDAEEEVFRLDVFFDMNMAGGASSCRAAPFTQLKADEGDVRINALRSVPTASGFATEQEQHQYGGEETTGRRLWLCDIGDGRIAEAVGYCSGEWDEARRVRHAAEPPMRP